MTLTDIPLTDGVAFFLALAERARATAARLDAEGYPDLALTERGIAADFEERAQRLAKETT